MVRPRLVVTSGSVALLLAGSAWAGPPPPPPGTMGPPSEESRPMRPGSAPPPPSSFGSEAGAAERIEAPRDPLVIDQRTPETDISGAWRYSRGGSTGPNYIRGEDDFRSGIDPYFTINPIGYYQGVSVQSSNTPPFAPKVVGGESAVLTWTGFERDENSSRVFFQLSAAVEPEVSVAEDKIVVELPRTAVQVRNNRRKLITRYFKTPVDEVEIQRKGKSVRAVLELRWPSTPTWELRPGANGYQMLVFEFADVVDGDASEPSDAPVPPPPPPSPNDSVSNDEESSESPFLPSS